MLAAEARVETERPGRYLAQICKHIRSISSSSSHLRHGRSGHLADTAPPRMQADVQWSDTRGTLSLGWAEVTLEASPGVLMLRAEAADEPALQQVQDLLGGLVGRVGRRADLMVSWQRLEARP